MKNFDGIWKVTITSAKWWACPFKWISNYFGTVKIIQNGIGRNVTGIFSWGSFVVGGGLFEYKGFFDSLYETNSEDVFTGVACTYVSKGKKSFLKFEIKRF